MEAEHSEGAGGTEHGSFLKPKGKKQSRDGGSDQEVRGMKHRKPRSV